MVDALGDVLSNLLVALFTLLLTSVVGQKIVTTWAVRQKRRELELELANQFYSHYGEFRAVWKLWNDLLASDGLAADEVKSLRASLHERAAVAEGGMEAALLKVAAERMLTADEQADLGNLRQAFQVLYERIRDGQRISYGGSENPDYLEFKRLATRFGTMLASTEFAREPSATQAYEAFREITSNRYEARWRHAGRKSSLPTQGRASAGELPAKSGGPAG